MYSAAIIPFRPAALHAIGFRVDVHEFADLSHVILFQNRVLAGQWSFSAKDEADGYARSLAEDHRCALVRHNHRDQFAAQRSKFACECLSCQDPRRNYPCLIEDEI